MRFPPYPEYKPSGVEWLGDVPAHWNIIRLKFMARRKDIKVEAAEEIPMPYVGLENIEPRTGKLLRLDSELVPTGISNLFSHENTLFGKLRPYLAKACNPDFDGICSSELLVLEPQGNDRRYLLYQLLTEGFTSLVDASTYGAKMPRASWDFIASCRLPRPPIEEQRSISNYLDRSIKQLDRLVAKKRALIEALLEQRVALISRTVTRGLPGEAAVVAGFNPNPKFKASRLAWLGILPAHWEITKVGYVTEKVGSGKTPKGGAETYQSDGVLFIRSQNVYDTGLRLTDAVFIDESTDEDMSTSRVRAGDILLNITGASLGRCAIVPENLPRANVNQHVCVIRTDRNRVLPQYLQLVISSSVVQSQIFSFETGSSREGLNFNQVRSLTVPLPDLPEQRAIAGFLDFETAKIDHLIAQIEGAIQRLIEYRTAVMTAAVTGKIDVRGASA